MANFRSTSDYVTSILQLAGEVTNGNSPYLSKAVEHLDAIHKTIIMGGNEFNLEVDETWPWAMAREPMYIELVPAIEGTVSWSQGSDAITFTSAPQNDLAANQDMSDWFIKLGTNTTIYKINAHTAGATSASLNSNVVQTSGTDSYTAYKLIYDLESSHIQIKAGVNDRLYFAETTAKTLITSNLTVGTYTPAELATEVQTQLNAGGASTYTVTYNTDRKTFTLTTDGSGGNNVFYLIAENSLSSSEIRARSAMPSLGLGLRDLLATTISGSQAKIESDVIYGAVGRLAQPIKLHVNNSTNSDYLIINALDPLTFDHEYPLYQVDERNPTAFKILDHTAEGKMTVQFNYYPEERVLIEVPYVPLPVDLYNNATSHPLTPRLFSKILEYGAAAWLLYEKNDDKWQGYYKLAGDKLQSMMINNRKTDQRLSKNFGEIIARQDLMPSTRKKLSYGYGDY